MRNIRLSVLAVGLAIMALALSGCQTFFGTPEPPVTWVPLPTVGPSHTPTQPPTATLPATAAPTEAPTLRPSPTATPAPQALAPSDPAEAAEWARDQAWEHLVAQYPDQRWPTSPKWVAAGADSRVGATEYRFQDGDWQLTCAVPVVAPGQAIYAVRLEGPEGVRWDAQVRPDGTVNAEKPVELPSEELVDGWGGTVHSLPASSPYDDLFRVLGGRGGQYGITSTDAALAERIKGLRDTNRVVVVWGTLKRGATDYGDAQLVVERIEEAAGATPAATAAPTSAASAEPKPPATVAPTGQIAPPVARATAAPASKLVEGWVGVIRRLPATARYADYFDAREPVGQYGVAGLLPRTEAEIEAWRDSGVAVRVWGVLDYGMADYGGARITVTRIEALE